MTRSSVEPQTMASETAQNANWNRNFASIEAADSDITGRPELPTASAVPVPATCRKNPLLPMIDASVEPVPNTSPLPNAKAKPTAQ